MLRSVPERQPEPAVAVADIITIDFLRKSLTQGQPYGTTGLMQKKDLLREMNQMGIVPSKKMGQNFLIDDNFLDWMIREADLQVGDHILEVGPGFGALTSRMLTFDVRLTAIEFDRKLAEWLRHHLIPDGLNLIEGDACKVDIANIYGPQTEFKLISNLPYSAGTVVIANLLDLELPPTSMLVMLQKEVAMRFAADPGCEDYGALTARIQSVYQVEILRIIPPELFYPRPEIDSCVIRLTRRADMQSRELRKILSRLTRTAFAHRRKKMLKQIASVFGLESVTRAMTAANVDLDIRAERVTVSQFRQMAEILEGESRTDIPSL